MLLNALINENLANAMHLKTEGDERVMRTKRLKHILIISIVALTISIGMTFAASATGVIYLVQDGSTITFPRPQTIDWYESYGWDKFDKECIKKITFKKSSYFTKDVEITNDRIVEIVGGGGAGEYSVTLKRVGSGECDVYLYDRNWNRHTVHIKCENTPFQINKSSYTFSSNNRKIFFNTAYDDYVTNNIRSATCSNNEIVSVNLYFDFMGYCGSSNGGIYIVPRKPGNATVSFYNNQGEVVNMPVTVKKGYFKKSISKARFDVFTNGKRIWIYGDTGCSNAKIKIKIGKKTYKFKTSDYGDVYKTIKKKVKKNTKYKLTVSSNGYKKVIKGKVHE